MVGIQFDKSESSIGLHPDLGDVSIALEQRDEVGLGGVGDKIANVDCTVEIGCLSSHRVVGEVCAARCGPTRMSTIVRLRRSRHRLCHTGRSGAHMIHRW